MYQMPVFFGSSKNKARLALDHSTTAALVTSDICSNCKTKAYKPGTSLTTFNENTKWQFDLDQSGNPLTLQVIEFKDSVCLTPEDDICIKEFEFYSIYNQKGLNYKLDGVLGLAPI